MACIQETEPPSEKRLSERPKSNKWLQSRSAQDDSSFAVALKELRRSHRVPSVGADALTELEREEVALKQKVVRKHLEAIAAEHFRASKGLDHGWWDETLQPCGAESYRNRCAMRAHSNVVPPAHRGHALLTPRCHSLS